jgi:transcriptional regulator with XRE-family HTH domain
MTLGIDPESLGERLRNTRAKREFTLKEVSEATGLSIATLSRIERGEAKSLNGDTLIEICDWMGVEVESLSKEPPTVVKHGKPVESTPDIVELHLRADKNLDQKTARALATLFRTVYEQVTTQIKRK